MEEYAKSLQNLTEIRKVEDRNEALNKEEMKLYRKMTGNIAWLLTPQDQISVTRHCKCLRRSKEPLSQI